VRIRYRIAAVRAAGPEVDPGETTSPVQVILYTGDEPTAVEGTATTYPDGLTVIELPVIDVPPPETPVQIIIYPPDADPSVIEGTTFDSGDPLIIGISITPLAAE
jgi:hypothetical protein